MAKDQFPDVGVAALAEAALIDPDAALMAALNADPAPAGERPVVAADPLPFEDPVKDPTGDPAQDPLGALGLVDLDGGLAASLDPIETGPALSKDEDYDEEDDDLDGFTFPVPAGTSDGQGKAAGPGAGYRVDDSFMTILREEAEREAMVRRGEPVPLETQPDLGVDAAMPDRQTAHGASAKPNQDLSSAAPEDGAARPPARRDLLPDVEEINSTLRPTGVADGPEAVNDADLAAADRNGGFRSGFLMVMTVSIIGAGVYALSPQISAAVPSLADPLQSYIGGVDALRLALDGVMRSATVALNGG